jgi:hypothetical protein
MYECFQHSAVLSCAQLRKNKLICMRGVPFHLFCVFALFYGLYEELSRFISLLFASFVSNLCILEFIFTPGPGQRKGALSTIYRQRFAGIEI